MKEGRMENQEGEKKVVIAFQEGRQGGIPWVRGYRLEIDPATEKIISVEAADSEWRDKDLRRDAVQISSIGENDEELGAPKPGDTAPDGWKEWRSE